MKNRIIELTKAQLNSSEITIIPQESIYITIGKSNYWPSKFQIINTTGDVIKYNFLVSESEHREYQKALQEADQQILDMVHTLITLPTDAMILDDSSRTTWKLFAIFITSANKTAKNSLFIELIDYDRA